MKRIKIQELEPNAYKGMFAGSLLAEGDYLFTPPNYKHAVKSESGCTLLLVIPEEVEKL